MAVNVAVLMTVLVGTDASQRATSADAADGMMASMARAMPAMMNLRICVLSFVGRADVIGGMPTKHPWRTVVTRAAENCGELRCGLRGRRRESGQLRL